MSDPIIVACSCDASSPLDAAAIARACPGAKLQTASQLCRRQMPLFQALLTETDDLVVGCVQERPIFEQTAQEDGYEGRLAFVNVRETAGWSDQAAEAGPKIGALLAAGRESAPAARSHTMESQGVVLIYGRDEAAVEAGAALAADLDVTVIVTGEAPIAPPRVTVFPVARGRVARATGALGGFEVTLDGFARPAPSSRDHFVWGEPRDGAVSRCDLLLDLSGGAPLFPAHELRSGYLRADPFAPAQIEQAIRKAAALVGTFDKPRAIDFRADLCAHSRNRRIGCRRCLDLCPTGAISPDGDHVAIDPSVCAGCGQCAAACPTGAAGYASPPADALMRRLRRMILAYGEAGGADALVLVHDGEHGAGMIEALARHSNGLPAYALPLEVAETTQVGAETIAAAFAFGATGVAVLTRARPRHDAVGLERTVEIAGALASGLGFGADVVKILACDDPDSLRRALDEFPPGETGGRPAGFMPAGRRRDLLNQTLIELHAVAPSPQPTIPLPEGAPLGGLSIDVGACSLCLSCVPVCPVGALGDDAERPRLTFDEGACVQCGLCAATCPEKAIALAPRVDFPARAAGRVTVKEEEPFACVACGKPFGTRSSVEKIVGKLAGHWMYSGERAGRLDLIRMCEDCRAIKSVTEGLDPHGAPPRPKTTDDYLRERDAPES
jgi:ferredoxin